MVRFEKSPYYAVWFNGKLVYNNIGDHFNPNYYGRQSYLMNQLLDKQTGLSEKKDTFIHGEWETVLDNLSKNIDTIVEKRKLINAENEKTKKWFEELYEAINTYIPFHYGLADPGYDRNKSWNDDVIHITGRGEENLKIFVYRGEKQFLKKRDEVLVYDYATSLLKKGSWQSHLEEVLDKERKRRSKRAAMYGYSTKKPISTKETKKEEQQQKPEKTAKEWLSEIKAYTT